LIGINNLKFAHCTKEVVLVGLIRVLQQVQYYRQQQQEQIIMSNSNHKNKHQQDHHHHPLPWIVMNSILPVAAEKDGTQLDPVLWPSIQWINHRLECYIQGLWTTDHQQHVMFFNATSLFLVENHSTTGGFRINETLLEDGLHPSPRGQEIWGRQIVKTVLELIPPSTT
jgi:hypothetical protein